MLYKALVTNKMNGVKVTIESDERTKADFIHDLRRNGYAVNPIKVKPKEVFDYIINNTNCSPWDWQIKIIPNE